MNNLLEFAFGTNPTQPVTDSLSYALNGNVTRSGTPLPLRKTSPRLASPSNFIRCSHDARNHAAAGLTYTVKFSADLTLWTASAATPTLRSGASSPSNMDVVKVPFLTNVSLDAGGSAMPTFFRVEVTGN